LSSPALDLRVLFRLSRSLKHEELAPEARVEQLFAETRELQLSPLARWSDEELSQGRLFAEEMIVGYVTAFHDPSRLPVTYYKRERWVRRHLDGQFSRLLKEIQRRAYGKGPVPSAELITEEPIYYLSQKAREKSFPRGPRSKNRAPHLATLRIRLHVALSARLDPHGLDRGERRVLLPNEI
jgi:hypothetical protein